MRILKFFFLALVWILVISFVVFFLGREIILFFGAGILKNDYNILLRKSYAKLCIDQFSYGQDYLAQIRFTSNREYNLEVVCADFSSSPILLEKRKLLPLLFKKSFGSGFIIDERKLPFSIELETLGRSINVYAEDENISLSYLGSPDLDYDQGPISSCQAHNYQCCSIDLQSGLGKQITEVNDCPKSCYESCLLRPIFLSFNSRPFFEEINHVVELSAGETLTLSYVLGNGKGDVFSGQINKNVKTSILEQLQTVFSGTRNSQLIAEITLPVTIKIDFGDGEVWESNNFQDSVDHVYNCQTQTCYFQTHITAQDAKGVLSVDNETSKIIVKVHR